ncbi:extracellular solute-binding protein [Neptuniibacter caesariensis]|nr:extracellular solute-binding protein [Neptuniibacter caesariensis]
MATTVSFNLSAGEQADKAVRQVNQLIASGEIKKGALLRIVAKQGNIANFLGQDLALKELWQQETGTFIDANTMPQKASLDFIQQASNVDLTIARNREYPDLYHQNLIEDLTPLAARFGFDLVADTDLILPEMQSSFNGKQVAIPADGDIAVLYLRRDLIEDAEKQKAFRAKYGIDLNIPQTWDEYQKQVEFFDQSANGFYGSLEQRDQASAWMFWMLRYASQKFPNQYLFDKEMQPLVNSQAGIEATRSYIATLPFSPEGILDPKSNYTFTLPKFLNGQGYSMIITLAGAKILNLPHSKVREKYIAVPVPGNKSDGSLNRRTTLIYGNNIVIPKGAANKELAYLFAMWLTDPDISKQALLARGGFSDPYRYSHYTSEQMEKVYSKSVLVTVKSDLALAVPAGTGLPGDTEYISALNKQLFLASQGKVTPEQAMREVERSWQQITEKYGRESQKTIWQNVRALYPGFSSKVNE